MMMRPFSDQALKTTLEYFYEWERAKPDTPFLRQPYGDTWREISWREAGLAARRLASALLAMGMRPGDKVGIVSKNCYHWILADLGIMMAGLVSVPFYPNLTAAQLRQVLELSDAKILFVGKLENWREMSAGVPQTTRLIAFPHYEGNDRVEEGEAWDEVLARHEPIAGDPLPGLHDIWTILFTSGTTGAPKGVTHSYHAPATLMHNEKINGNLKIFSDEDHRFFSYLPLNHIAERIIVEVAAILTGGTVSFAESIDTFARNLQATQPTLFMAVPRIWSKFQLGILARLPQKRLDLLLRLPLLSRLIKRKIQQGLGLAHARILLTGAAPTPDALKDWFARLGLQLQEVYAMTENCGGCTLMPIEAIRPGTVGKPLPNVELRIDPQSGEVLTRAPWLMLGYYKDEAKTAEVMRDGWLHTGDAGYLDEAGYLCLTGRVSDTFKSAKGKYIVPAPIEWGFAKNPMIEQIAVVGLALPQPLALVVLSDLGQAAGKEEIEAGLRESLEEVNAGLAAFEKLKSIVVVNEAWDVYNGLLTPTMKIRRGVINQKYQAHFQQWFESPAKIIWQED
jgi:long-chain acyl-CoA synthetase